VDKSENFDKLVSEKKISLAAGDVVVLYTDGVTEAMNSHWEEFGEQRLRDTLSRQAGAADAETILMRLEQDVNQFCGEFPQSDDIAVVAFKVG
jgi:phosphoserine phosphatase RsbU/P